jgi:glycosyltransferase involved in cell wall biosynthesis
VVVTGFVDEQTKRSAIAGATALVQPSYFESFSMVVTEAWAQSRPVLVQGRCAVLEGHARRSHGGIPYCGFAEFEVAVETLAGSPALATALGEAGRRYVEDHYSWDRVLERYEDLLQRAAASPVTAPSSTCS